MASEAPILLVEDDPNIADLVEMYLRRDGYRVIQASSAARAMELATRDKPRLVVLDIGLPGGVDGLDLCRSLRSLSNVPVIMVTARDSEMDRVLGLEIGADDYVSKPFSPRELMARIKAILRRSEGDADAPTALGIISLGAVEVDSLRREARLEGSVVQLATKEFDLLLFFASNLGLALSRRQLLDGVWGPGWYGDDRTVDVHVRQLRKKLGGAQLPLATVWGVGYRLG